MRKFIISLVFSILCASLSHAATIYVDRNLGSNCTSGNYSIANRNCTGSDGNAYKTVAGGIGAMLAGSTLNIRAGTYTENNMTINLGGTNTIQAYNSEAVTIHNSHQATDTGQGQCGDNSSGVQTIYPAGSNVTFIGIKFTGSIGTFNEEYNAVAIGMGSSGYLIIDNCEFTGFNHVAIKHSGRLWLKNSYIHDLGVTAGDHGVYSDYRNATNRTIIEHNYFENITGAGLQQYGNSNGGYWIIRNNIFRNCGKNYNGPICGQGGNAWAIILSGDNNEVYNNTIDGSHWGIMYYKAASANNIVKNNIIRNCDYGVIGDTPGSGNITSYNYFSSNIFHIANTPNSGNNIFNDTNPFVVVSPSHWYDFRLTSGSACVNAGTNLGASHDDGLNPNDTIWPPSTLNQNNYGGWEIGAFVFTDGDAPPSAPAGLKIVQ